MAGRRTAASGGSREESSVRKRRNPGTRAPVRDDELHGGPGRGPARGAAVTLRLRHGGADVRDRSGLCGAHPAAAYAPYSTAGQVLVDAESGQPLRRCSAEREERWPSEQQWWQRLEVPRRRTQGRRLELAGRLTGGSAACRGARTIATRRGDDGPDRRRPRLGPVVGRGGRRWRRCCMPLPAARCWTAWPCSAGGRRARDGWRAGRRPAPVGCWRRPVVLEQQSGAHRRPPRTPIGPPAAALRWAHGLAHSPAQFHAALLRYSRSRAWCWPAGCGAAVRSCRRT